MGLSSFFDHNIEEQEYLFPYVDRLPMTETLVLSLNSLFLLYRCSNGIIVPDQIDWRLRGK
jgi:hypothetical protein